MNTVVYNICTIHFVNMNRCSRSTFIDVFFNPLRIS